MKTKPFIIFLALILLGCSNDNFELPTALMHNQVDIDACDDAVAVTKYDIQNIVSSFGNGSSENQSRSTFYNNYSLSTIYDSTGNPAIYVVNYDNNAGFVLVSATKDYHPILAYAEIGNYDIMNSRPYGLDMWEQNTVDAVKESASLPADEKVIHNIEWLRYSPKNNAPILRGPSHYEYITDEEYEELKLTYLATINDLNSQGKTVYPYEKSSWQQVLNTDFISTAEVMASQVYWTYEDIWQDFATLVYWEEYSENTTPITVRSTWTQKENYNSEFRRLPNGELPFAGCGPIAAGQIMRYFQHPVKYNWEQMPLNYATSVTSKFLFDVAESAHAIYGDNTYGGGTSTTIENMRKVFTEYGYTADEVKPASPGAMVNSLLAGSPVYIRGDNGSAGHAWVAAGLHTKSYTMHYDVYNFGGRKSYGYRGTALQKYLTYYYFYFNWGWGHSDGYYMLDDVADYNKNMKVILNIKPK